MTVLAISIASLHHGAAQLGLLGLAAVGLLAFLAWDRCSAAGVLPRSAFAAGSPMRWVLLANGLLTVAVVIEAFAPLFGQQMAGLPPLVAGLFGAAVSFGWSFFGLLGARAVSPRAQSAMIVVGPVLLAAGLLATALTQAEPAGPMLAVLWFVLMIIGGAGIGLAFPNLSVATLASAPDAEAAKAGSAIPLTGLLAQSFGAAIAGLLVNAGLPSMPQAATNLYLALAGFAALSAVCAVLAVRGRVFGSTQQSAPAP